MKFLLLLNLIIPFVMILVGYILKKHPVTDMSKHNGYNTPTSRKSQEHWDYAQSIAPDIFIFIGRILSAIELILCLVMVFFQASIYVAIAVGECVGFAFMIYAFYKTDSEVEKKFLER